MGRGSNTDTEATRIKQSIVYIRYWRRNFQNETWEERHRKAGEPFFYSARASINAVSNIAKLKKTQEELIEDIRNYNKELLKLIDF